MTVRVVPLGVARLAGLNVFTANNVFNASVAIGASSAISKFHVAADADFIGAGGWATGQIQATGATNTNRRLALGYSTADNFGFIQAGEHNVAYRDLLLQRAGGNLGVIGGTEFGGGDRVLALANAITAPTSNPSSGVIVYAASGEVRARTASGVHTITPASGATRFVSQAKWGLD